jgi:hypothetical protein
MISNFGVRFTVVTLCYLAHLLAAEITVQPPVVQFGNSSKLCVLGDTAEQYYVVGVGKLPITKCGASGYLVDPGARSRPPQWK